MGDDTVGTPDVAVQTPEPPWETAFARNLRAERERRGWSQSELARRLTRRIGLFHQQQVQRIETGARPVRLNEAIALADLLGTDLETLTAPPDRAGLLRRARDAAAHLTYRNVELSQHLTWALHEVDVARRALEHAWSAYEQATADAGEQADPEAAEEVAKVRAYTEQLQRRGEVMLGTRRADRDEPPAD